VAESRGTADWRDVNFAANMVRLRTSAGMSQADLVNALRNAPAGARWEDVHPTTISRIEKGERQVRFSEAFYIARALGSDPVEMTLPPRQLDIEERVDNSVAWIAESYTDIGWGVWAVSNARFNLRELLSRLRKIADGHEDAEERQRLLDRHREAEIYLSLRVDAAVAAGREATRDGRVQTRSDFNRIYGVSPHSYTPESVNQGDIDAPDA
jgi:transcriptional regulator with XRE-family HTH domain